MYKKKVIISLFLIMFIILIPTMSLADTLNIDISIDKEDVKVGDIIIVKIAWNKGVQAADFSLNYNSKKLEYLESDIDAIYINNQTESGELKTAWISVDDTDKNHIEYTFKVKKGGKLKFSTKINGGFAKGNLEVFDDYNNNELTIKVPRNNLIIIVLSISIIFIVLVIILKKGGKK